MWRLALLGRRKNREDEAASPQCFLVSLLLRQLVVQNAETFRQSQYDIQESGVAAALPQAIGRLHATGYRDL